MNLNKGEHLYFINIQAQGATVCKNLKQIKDFLKRVVKKHPIDDYYIKVSGCRLDLSVSTIKKIVKKESKTTQQSASPQKENQCN